MYENDQPALAGEDTRAPAGAFDSWVRTPGMLVQPWVVADPLSVDILRRLVRCYYWAISTLVTLGCGDILAVSVIEAWYVLLLALAAQTFMSLAVGSASLHMSNEDASITSYEHFVNSLSSVLRHRAFPLEQRERLLHYFAQSHVQQKLIEEEASKVLVILPDQLRKEITAYVNFDIIMAVKAFRGVQPAFVKSLALALDFQFYFGGDTIIREGNVGQEMFFVNSGIVEISVAGVVIAHKRVGMYFGEVALISAVPRTATALAATDCDMFTLSRGAFERILLYFPQYRGKNLSEWASATALM
jgi:hypothetical protein